MVKENIWNKAHIHELIDIVNDNLYPTGKENI